MGTFDLLNINDFNNNDNNNNNICRRFHTTCKLSFITFLITLYMYI